jgi:hypothetical protein
VIIILLLYNIPIVIHLFPDRKLPDTKWSVAGSASATITRAKFPCFAKKFAQNIPPLAGIKRWHWLFKHSLLNLGQQVAPCVSFWILAVKRKTKVFE